MRKCLKSVKFQMILWFLSFVMGLVEKEIFKKLTKVWPRIFSFSLKTPDTIHMAVTLAVLDNRHLNLYI